MENDLRTEKLERYLLGRLSDTEREALEQELKEDPELAEALELERAVHSIVESDGRSHLKSRLQQIDAGTRTKPGRRRSIYIGAAAILLLGIAFLVIRLNGDPRSPINTRVLAQIEERNPLETGTSKGGTEAWEKTLESAYEDVRNKRFDQAAKKFQDVLTTSSGQLDAFTLQKANLGFGISLLASGKSGKEVLSPLELAYNQGQGSFWEPALWFKGMAYLESGETAKARQSFQELVTKAGAYYWGKKAAEEIERLEEEQ